ncbi:TIGR02757 family protein [Flavobacterium branchiophilum]|uniref:TIGR02757 family protein n=1 Tax=Flavobacterium branchiophilum TaxID=55197 RepID=A0A2H3KTQ7_9FLAO|nr:TIGR02757 family protein [Flavobacterium branchiophilum]PDS23319.1 TIGR02757 family protein [Flavobacterium branchiophilum]
MAHQKLHLVELKEFLDEKVHLYNRPQFIESDPIAIPHQFSVKEDIEIAAFLSATIAWGNRKMIIKNAQNMIDLLDQSPFDFVKNHHETDLKKLEQFVHRTFNGHDFIVFIKGLQHLYNQHNGLESVFYDTQKTYNIQEKITLLKKLFFEIPHTSRTQKHISDPSKQSAAKRLNMFLRWMVRQDNCGVDFGIWKSISPSLLSCPLDVHSGNVARKLGLLTRTQNDAKALAELDKNLKILDPNDPVKYDFALFGLGVFENF